MLTGRQALTLLSLICLTVLFAGCGSEKKTPQTYEAEIEMLAGRYLWTNQQRSAALVGIYIPLPGEANYQEASYAAYQKMLLHQSIKLRIVESRHKDGYPQTDLAEVYTGDLNVNRYLLEQGMAFFNEDHWDRNEKESYRTLEAEARGKKAGLWSAEEVKVLFLRPKNGRFIHYPDCPHVKDLEHGDRVEYHSPVPMTPFMAVRNAYFCDFCRPRFEKSLEALQALKLRLES